MKKITILLGGLLLGVTQSFAQTIDASPETQTICGGGTATLTAVVTPGGGGGSAPTTSYAISSIPYGPDPFGAGTVVGGMADDSQSGILPIGFNFCFFGTTYTNFYVGSNGWVAFSPQPTTYTSATIPSTLGTIPKNCIMGPWQDWYPGLSAGCVKYQVYGVAPFRRLVVSYNNCPMFSCTSTLGTFQITIYETTNIIENHILTKPACLGWAGGTAVQGLHNAAGTVAFTVAGRNSTAWTAANEGWRYTPNGTSSYQINWYILPANVLIGTGPSITVTPPASPQYYYAQVIDLNACTGSGSTGTNTDTVVVLTNTVAVDAGVYTPICPGSSTTLNATSGTALTFTWSPGGSLSNPAISNPIATPGATTTYTVLVTDAMGCFGSDTVTVAFSSPVANAGSGVSICLGSSTTLNATGGASYSWSPATGLSSSTIANPVANPIITTSYTVTATQGTCTSTAVVMVTVNPLPTVDAGSGAALCTGSTTTLNGSGATGYVWSPAASLSSSTISNPVSSATATTTYTMVGTDGNGCVSTDSVVITVNPLPTIDAGPSVTICEGSSTTLSATGGISYTWSPAGSLSNASISNPVATPTATTIYIVNGTDANGCSTIDLVAVNVSPISVSASSASPAVCIGNNTTVTAAGGASYAWSPAATLSSSTILNPIATPVTTTTYTVIGTSGAGCLDTAFVTVVVNPLPTVDAGSPIAFCPGGATVLNGSGATSYSWSPGAGLSSTTTFNPIASPTTTTTYTVVGTDGNGCSASDNVTITVNPIPLVDAGASISICPGTSTTLGASGATTYVWSPGSTLSSTSGASPVATPPSATTYTVTGTSSAGCTATDVVTISVSGISVTASSATPTICTGSNTTLTGSGATSYTWSPAATLSSSTIANPIASPTTTTTYTVIGTAGTGCIDTAFVTVNVNALPTIGAGSPVAICPGTTTGLTATGGIGYVWSPAGSLTGATTATPTSSAIATTTYTVVGTDINGCTSTNTVTVTVNPLPTASAGIAASVCTGSSTTLTGTGGGTYSWSPAGTLSSSTISNPVATPIATTTYTVTVTSGAGCTATSTVVVTVNVIPTATASADVVICNGASTLLTAGGGGTYLWSPAGSLSSATSPTPTATPSSTTTYTVTVSNGFCTNTADVIVTVNNILSMATATTTSATCGNANGSITAGAITGGSAPFTYSLNGGAAQSSSTFTGVASSSYTLTVTDGAGCTATQTVLVGSVLGVNAAFSASPTSGVSPLTVNLTNGSTGASNYIWDFDNGSGSVFSNPTTVYNANGSYTITLVAYNGSFACSDTATITIEVFEQGEMVIPNVFTPNGDGHNDMFVVISVGIKEMSGTIFNRWGKKVGEWNGSANGWDGKINGKDAEDGTYYYVIKATGNDGKEYDAAGFVELLSGK